MHARENLKMEPGRTSFSTRRGVTLSFTTIFILLAFFVCSLVAAGFLIYNFAVCPAPPPATASQMLICTSKNTYDSNGQSSSTSSSSSSNSVDYDKNEHFDNHSSKSKTDTDVRLPRSIIPKLYNISLIPFLMENNFTFHGEATIRIKILEDSRNITLHSADMEIHKEYLSVRPVTVIEKNSNHANNTRFRSTTTLRNEVNNNATSNRRDDSNNRVIYYQNELRIKSQYYLEQKQFYIIELHEPLKKDNDYEIYIKYTGNLRDNLQGFYRSSYQVGEEKRWLAITQFQPTDARRAFPCFDEPAFKAEFIINIARPENMSAISNMPLVPSSTRRAVDELEEYVWDTFEKSVPMSTYLVAFAVTDFNYLRSGNFSVWARSDSIASAKYSLQIGPKILKYLEEFFNIPFPLPKIDMIALPDFNAGAMENWGLITFREATMLYEEGVSATGNRQRIATVVGHELAHQWFGNLVTPSWWSDIWLNEGFASYMEYFCVDGIEPSWKVIDQFIVAELHSVFQFDALTSSHKISVEVGNPDEINEIFDKISYSKGSTIIRMMNHFLTSRIFRMGLTNYLNQTAYKSATQDDLWNFLTEVALSNSILDPNTTVKEIMDTWTLQTGFPLVTIIHDAKTNRLRLKQERFMYSSKLGKNKTDDALLWWIPLSYTTSKNLDFNNTKPSHWMRRTKYIEIKDENISKVQWYIFNIQQTGYYRVNYAEYNWKAIIEYLLNVVQFNKIPPSNRAQLIDDALNLARAGYLSYDIALDVTKYLAHEDEYVPWKAAINSLNFLDSMLIREGDYYLFKKYILNLIDMVYEKVGFEDSKDEKDMLTIYKRIDILHMACHFGHAECIHKCRQQFYNWMAEANPDFNNPISPNLKAVVYCTAIRYGTEREWDFAFERFLRTKVSSENEVLLSTLGCTREPWILARFLERAFSDNHVRKQDVYKVLYAVAGNTVGRPIAFNYIRSNWQKVKNYLGSSMSNLYSIVKAITYEMNNQFELEELLKFVHDNHLEQARTIQQAIEHIRVNIDWMNQNYRSIINWLEKVVKKSTRGENIYK